MRTITLEEHFATPAFLAGRGRRLAEGARLPGRLPFMLQRLDMMTVSLTQLKRPISAYLRQNIHYTFSGFNFTPTFLDLFLQVGVDRTRFLRTRR